LTITVNLWIRRRNECVAVVVVPSEWVDWKRGKEGKDTGERERGTREKTKIVQFFNSGNVYFHGVTLINYKI